MSNDLNAPLGAALALGSLSVASNLRISEPAGKSRDRMTQAVESLTEKTRHDGPILAGDLITAFSEQTGGAPESDRRGLLIELAVSNPFSPYWFAMNERRETCRVRALKLMAALSLNLEPDSVTIVVKAWRKAARDLVTVASYAPAGPLIALAAAGGPSESAAMSAGLTHLGFGTIGEGLHLLGGRWLLGSAAGPISVATDAVVKEVVATPESAHLIALEVCKLVLTVKLARGRKWFEVPIEAAGRAVDNLTASVRTELDDAAARNDPKAKRVRELAGLHATCIRAAAAIGSPAARSEGAS